MPNDTVPAIEQSPIQYQKIMDGKEVITAIKGYMLQAGNNVKGVLVEHVGNTLSTTALARDSFDREFKKSVSAAHNHLDEGQTRIIVPIHLGNHFATVAIDTKFKTAVIVEPTNSYKKEIERLDGILKEMLPTFNVQISQTKIQDDGFSCGPIASKLAAHLLTCNENLVTAIDVQHLPAMIHPLNTEDKKKALVADVQKAYKTKMDVVTKNDLEYDCAIQATVMGLLNLIATGQLDNDKYDATKKKLLELYQAYLDKEADGKTIDPIAGSWDNFKQFLLAQNTEAKQLQLKKKFTHVFSNQILQIIERNDFLPIFHREMLEQLEKEFADYLVNKPTDGKEKNYERFTYIKNQFKRFKRDQSLVSQQDKIEALNNWWNTEGKNELVMHYHETGDGKKFPNEFDLRIAVRSLTYIDLEIGPDKDHLSNLYTFGHGYVNQEKLDDIFGAMDISKILTDLCDEGVFRKIGSDSNVFYRFEKMSEANRKGKLQKIIADNFADVGTHQNYLDKLLALVELRPTLALTRQGAQWGIIDTVPNTPWLKVKSFKAELPEQTPANDERAVVPQNSVTTAKLDFTKPNVKQKFKDICAEFKQKNADKNYEVVSDDKMNINGEVVTVLSDGFEFANVNKEIIEFCVKAMAEAFTHESINDQAQRVVKLTLLPKYEKFRKDYREELKKYNLTLEEDAANMLRPNGKWQGVHDQHNSEVQPSGVTQPSADTSSSSTPGSSATGQTAAPTSRNTPSVSNPAASTSTPTAGASPIKSPPLSGSATGSVAATTAPDQLRPGARR